MRKDKTRDLKASFTRVREDIGSLRKELAKLAGSLHKGDEGKALKAELSRLGSTVETLKCALGDLEASGFPKQIQDIKEQIRKLSSNTPDMEEFRDLYRAVAGLQKAMDENLDLHINAKALLGMKKDLAGLSAKTAIIEKGLSRFMVAADLAAIKRSIKHLNERFDLKLQMLKDQYKGDASAQKRFSKRVEKALSCSRKDTGRLSGEVEKIREELSYLLSRIDLKSLTSLREDLTKTEAELRKIRKSFERKGKDLDNKVGDLSGQLKDLDPYIKVVRSEIEGIISTLDQVQEEQDRLSGENKDRLKREKEQKRRDSYFKEAIEELTDSYYSLREKINSFSEEVQHLARDLRDLSKQSERDERSISKKISKAAEDIKAIARRKADRTELQEELKKIQAGDYKRKLQYREMQQGYLKHEETVAGLSKKLKAIEESLLEHTADLNSIREGFREQQNRSAKEASSAIRQLEIKLDRKIKDSRADALETSSHQIKSLKRSIKDIEAKILDLKKLMLDRRKVEKRLKHYRDERILRIRIYSMSAFIGLAGFLAMLYYYNIRNPTTFPGLQGKLIVFLSLSIAAFALTFLPYNRILPAYERWAFGRQDARLFRAAKAKQTALHGRKKKGSEKEAATEIKEKKGKGLMDRIIDFFDND